MPNTDDDIAEGAPPDPNDMSARLANIQGCASAIMLSCDNDAWQAANKTSNAILAMLDQEAALTTKGQRTMAVLMALASLAKDAERTNRREIDGQDFLTACQMVAEELRCTATAMPKPGEALQ
jgi:hypothetical protein